MPCSIGRLPPPLIFVQKSSSFLRFALPAQGSSAGSGPCSPPHANAATRSWLNNPMTPIAAAICCARSNFWSNIIDELASMRMVTCVCSST